MKPASESAGGRQKAKIKRAELFEVHVVDVDLAVALFLGYLELDRPDRAPFQGIVAALVARIDAAAEGLERQEVALPGPRAVDGLGQPDFLVAAVGLGFLDREHETGAAGRLAP